jgi:mannose-1-phosphate guanylyltransferase
MPVLGEQLDAIGRALGTPSYKRVLARVFPECPSISIDYGVMEKSHRIAVVPADFGWSDVGSFAALPEVREQDETTWCSGCRGGRWSSSGSTTWWPWTRGTPSWWWRVSGRRT